MFVSLLVNLITYLESTSKSFLDINFIAIALLEYHTFLS